MKCLTSIITLAVLSITTVFARPTQVGTTSFAGLKYRLYTDGKATIYGTSYNHIQSTTIPASVTYQNKQYLVSEIAAESFVDKEVNKLYVDGGNTGLLIKKNAFYGMRGLKEFGIYSKYVTAEIGGFNGVGNFVEFLGEGIPNIVDDYSEKLLKQWDLPVRKNYKYVNNWERMQELFTLGKRVQETFGIYDKVANPANAANVMFIGAGSSNGVSRVYRLLAIAMGIPHTEVLVGSDNIYYSWNYVKIDIGDGKGTKWYIFDIIQDKIGKNTSWNLSAFKTDSQQVNKLKKFYGEFYTINANNFVVFTNRYNYPNESRVNDTAGVNFNTWVKNNNAGERDRKSVV